jgi:hypothetical protein
MFTKNYLLKILEHQNSFETELGIIYDALIVGCVTYALPACVNQLCWCGLF